MDPKATKSEIDREARAPLHVIFGAGQIGRLLAAELLRLGLRVRQVRRGSGEPDRPGLEWARADLTNAESAAEAARGAAVIYDCTNPAEYHRWDRDLPPLKRTVRTAAARVGSRLVVLDCLYMYGRPTRTPFDEDEPMRPCSRKGELRAMLARELFEAHARGELRATSGRASDYFGPGIALALLGERAGQRLRSGKAVEMGGSPDMPHSYSYGPDVAHGLAVLGTHPEADGTAWHLPVAWQGTTRELVRALASELGVTARIRAVPDWLFRAAALVSPLLAAAAEMTYQWQVPYLLDDRRFRAAFGVEPTPAAEAVAETARFMRSLGERAARAA
ncbi:MAG TPA: NAD-dependent epimerase/dehydratase family protein [Anaeromyxobacteraceae bacterium]|nr:NAD-dependent epimerase/dehydratase family protein [Anaeromyxobacteraceae bacterium]